MDYSDSVSFRIVDPRRLDLVREIFECDLAWLRITQELKFVEAVHAFAIDFGYLLEIDAHSGSHLVIAARSTFDADEQPLCAIAVNEDDALLAICALILDSEYDVFFDRNTTKRILPAKRIKSLQKRLNKMICSTQYERPCESESITNTKEIAGNNEYSGELIANNDESHHFRSNTNWSVQETLRDWRNQHSAIQAILDCTTSPVREMIQVARDIANSPIRDMMHQLQEQREMIQAAREVANSPVRDMIQVARDVANSPVRNMMRQLQEQREMIRAASSFANSPVHQLVQECQAQLAAHRGST